MWRPAGSRRSVYIQSTLKRRPGYRTLERDLIQLQQQQLFQIFVVVSLRKGSPGNTYSPEITQQFPKMVRKSLYSNVAPPFFWAKVTALLWLQRFDWMVFCVTILILILFGKMKERWFLSHTTLQRRISQDYINWFYERNSRNSLSRIPIC